MLPNREKPDEISYVRKITRLLGTGLAHPQYATLQGAIMAATITFLRVLYEAKEANKWRILFESLICGALSLSASSIIDWMTWPPSLSVAAGGAIGFIGVTAIRNLIIRFLGREADSA